MKFTSITHRFLFWFVLLALLPMLLIGYAMLHTFEQELKSTVSQQISAIADKKVDQIDAFLDERIKSARSQDAVEYRAPGHARFCAGVCPGWCALR